MTHALASNLDERSRNTYVHLVALVSPGRSKYDSRPGVNLATGQGRCHMLFQSLLLSLEGQRLTPVPMPGRIKPLSYAIESF